MKVTRFSSTPPFPERLHDVSHTSCSGISMPISQMRGGQRAPAAGPSSPSRPLREGQDRDGNRYPVRDRLAAEAAGHT